MSSPYFVLKPSLVSSLFASPACASFLGVMSRAKTNLTGLMLFNHRDISATVIVCTACPFISQMKSPYITPHFCAWLFLPTTRILTPVPSSTTYSFSRHFLRSSSHCFSAFTCFFVFFFSASFFSLYVFSAAHSSAFFLISQSFSGLPSLNHNCICMILSHSSFSRFLCYSLSKASC